MKNLASKLYNSDNKVPLTHLVSAKLFENTLKLLRLLFPEYLNDEIRSEADLITALDLSKDSLCSIIKLAGTYPEEIANKITQEFFESLESIRSLLLKDAEAALIGDPAARDIHEVILTYPGFLAVGLYRLAHQLYHLKVPLIPRIISERAHAKTGADIHPGAVIGESFFIDHATGVVIGETTVIGNNVKIYQGVTLGGKSVSKEQNGSKRHPTIEDNVVIYSNATILGGETLIGKGSVIGGNVWITESIPANSRVYHKAETILVGSEKGK
ncbi:MAG: serine acetyltransferase [Bdellovibrionales bacterium]|nr:serine acetyltransferase [Bdellovibrionales bacterium]